MADRPRAGPSDQHGFTLVEIMVALAVFSLAALALIRLQAATIRGVSTIGDTLVARMVANTVAIEALTDPVAPMPGRADGAETNGGRAWRWQRMVSGTPDPRIVRIDVGVADARGTVLGRATVVRRARSGE